MGAVRHVSLLLLLLSAADMDSSVSPSRCPASVIYVLQSACSTPCGVTLIAAMGRRVTVCC